MNKNKCANCKFWSKMNQGFGLCQLSKTNHPLIMKTPCGLRTNKNFGCILFKEKTKTIPNENN